MDDTGGMGRQTLLTLALLAAFAIGGWLWLRAPGSGDQDATDDQDTPLQSAGWHIEPPTNPAAVGPILSKAITSAGGEVGLQALASATWTRAYAWPGGELTGELLHEVGKGTLRRGVEPGVEVGRVGKRCWLRRADVVTGCALEDRALLRIHQAAHDATMLVNLARPPYRPVGVSAASRGRHGAQALFFDLDDGPWRVVVIVDVAGDHRAERVSLLHRQSRLAPIHCELDNVGPMAGIQVARTRRLLFEERMVPTADGGETPSVEIEQIRGLRPGVKSGALNPPPATAEGPMVLGSRPAMLVALADVASGHEGALAALDEAESLLPPELQLVEPEWFEVIGTGAEPPGTPKRVQVWVASALYVIGAERTEVGRRLTRVQAEARVARQVVRAPFSQLPERMKAFAARVRAAGHGIAPRPRVVRVVGVAGSSGDDPQGEPWLVELQLPLEVTAATGAEAP